MNPKDIIVITAIFILIFIFAGMILLFFVSIGVTSETLGNMPWITSIIIVFLNILGLKTNVLV